MAKKGLLFTVIYPQAMAFWEDFCASARAQTTNNFEILIVNDGCDDLTLEKSLTGLTYHIEKPLGSPSKNREQGVNFAYTHGYKYILFCDSDDTFLPDRYEKTLQKFESTDADIIVCNLNIVDEQLNIIIPDYFSQEIPEDKWIESSFITDKNIFGMSNTALRISSLSEMITLPETPIADWYLFTVLLNRGLKAKYINESYVNYRQYNANLIGITCFDVPSFRKLLKLKNNHFRLLVKNGYVAYNELYEKSLKLADISDVEIKELISKQLSIHKQPLWWQIVSNEIVNN